MKGVEELKERLSDAMNRNAGYSLRYSNKTFDEASSVEEFVEIFKDASFRNIDVRKIMSGYEEEFQKGGVFLNCDSDHGVVYCFDHNIKVRGDCKVFCQGRSIVNALNKCYVEAGDGSIVYASDNCNVRAYSGSTVMVTDYCNVYADDGSRVTAERNANIWIEGYGLEITARGFSTVYERSCEADLDKINLFDNAILRTYEGKIYCGSKNMELVCLQSNIADVTRVE